MKRLNFTLIIMLVFSVMTFGQLTGTKNIPGDYANVESAIFALNTLGVGTGGVTFNVAAGHTETLTSDSAGLITQTGNNLNPIVFQAAGTGANPVIYGCVTATGLSNYIIGLKGTDYITFNGIDVADPTAACEWGYAILKASAQDGSQYVTIKNCNITLKKSNTATIGIYSANIAPGAPGTQLSVDAPNGSNSNNKIFSNTITSCYQGIVLDGYNDPNSPFAYYDQSNEIGKDGGNLITNFGGSSVASNGIKTTYQDRFHVANNTISGTINGTAVTAGIQLGTSKNANANVYNNTVTLNMADANTNAFYGIWSNMSTTFTNNACNIYNNSITGCAYPKATSATAYYLYVTPTAATMTVYGNQITNNTYGSATATATGTVNCFYYQGSPSLGYSTYIYNNTISGNTRVQSVVGAGSTYYMWAAGGGSISGPLYQLYGNVVDNNTPASSGAAYGIYAIGASLNKQVFNNTVKNINNARGTVQGMYVSEGYSQTVYGNKISNITSLSSTSSSYIAGLYLNGSSYQGPCYAYNNFVSELKMPAGTNPSAIYGINAAGGSLFNLSIYHNTVYLDGTSSNNGFGTIGLSLGSGPKVVDVRNNIIINNTTPTGSGIATAIKSSSYSATQGINNYGPDCNHNDLYAGTPGPNHLIGWMTDGTNNLYDQSLADFKTRVWPKECYSIDEVPPFVNVAASPYDLHLQAAVPTQCEGSGQLFTTPISVVADIDNEARYPNPGYPVNPLYPPVGPDRGADEVGGLPIDALPPAIIYTALDNTASLTTRTLTASITDMNGVPLTGIGLPRVCWKKNYNGIWTYETGVSIGSNQYTFSFGDGVSLGDTVHYFLVAQDMYATPNAGTFPLVGSQGLSANPPAAITPPTTPSRYKIVTGICGVKTVGIGKDYETFTAAIADLSVKAISCPVVLELTDNNYISETYPIVIPKIAGTSATNTVTIRPAAGATPVFSTSYKGVSPNSWSMISLNGAEYIIFDGSNSGGNDRSMTFSNNATGGFVAAMGLYNNGYSGANNIQVRNCVLQAHSEAIFNTQGFTMYINTGNAGYHDIIIDNNEINSAKFAVQIVGIASNPTQNVQLTNNTIGSMDIAKAAIQNAVLITQCNNVLVEGNDIIGTADGYSFGPQSPMLISVSTGSKNLTIRRNKIHDVYSLTNGAIGIMWDNDATTLSEISNNVIYNIKSVGTTTTLDGANGSGLFFFSGSNLKIIHNTISLQGNYLSATTAALSSCVIFRNNITGIEFRDNILNNSSQPISGAPASKSYCIMAGNNPIFTNLNYNDYFCNGISPRIGFFAGNEQSTLADWQAATSQDANSVSVDPVFTAVDNMKPTTTAMVKAGTYIAALPTDYDGVSRTNPPDVGAYEYSLMPEVATTAATGITTTNAVLNGTVGPNGHTVQTYFDYGPTTNYGTSVEGTPSLVTGMAVQPVSTTLTGLTFNTTYHFRIRGITFTGIIVYGNDMTFTTADLSCPMPTAVMATSVTATTATLSWTEPSPAPGSGYEYEIRTTGDPGSGPSGLIATGTTGAGVVNAAIAGLTASSIYSAYVRSNCGDGSYSNWTYVVNFATMAENLSVTGVVGNGNINCYNAINVITVAGNGTTFEVQNGGSATFIAGQMISFLPGTTILAGGYMHGYITLTGEYCSSLVNPVVNNPVQLGDVKSTVPEFAKTQRIIAYPNPTTGLFTLEMNRASESTMSKVEVYSMSGVKVMSQDLAGERKHQFSLDGMSSGVYFIHVTASCGLVTLKMIKL